MLKASSFISGKCQELGSFWGFTLLSCQVSLQQFHGRRHETTESETKDIFFSIFMILFLFCFLNYCWKYCICPISPHWLLPPTPGLHRPVVCVHELCIYAYEFIGWSLSAAPPPLPPLPFPWGLTVYSKIVYLWVYFCSSVHVVH